MQTLFSPANLFNAFRLGISFALWAQQSCWFYLSTQRQSVFYHSSDLKTASTSTRRLSDARPRYIFRDFFKSTFVSVWPFETKRRLPEPADPAEKSDCDTDPRQRRIRETGRGAHAWHTSPFDLMAIPRMWWHLLRSINGCLIMSMMTPGRNTPVFHQGHNLKYSIHVWQIHHRNVLCLERDC